MKTRFAGFAGGALVYLGGNTRPTEGYSTVTPAPKKSRGFAFFPTKREKQHEPSSRPKFVVNNEGKAGSTNSATPTNRRGWHQRVWSKVLRRPKESTVTMNMQAVAADVEWEVHPGTRISHANDVQQDDIVDAYNSIAYEKSNSYNMFVPPPQATMVVTVPKDALENISDMSFPLLDRVSFISIDEPEHFAMPVTQSNVATTIASPGVDTTTDDTTDTPDRDSPFVRFTRNTFQRLLAERLDRWSNGTNVNTNIECHPTSSLLQFLRGQFYCDATVNLDRIAFGNKMRLSGGQLQAKNFCLNLLSFAPNVLPIASATRPPRYPNQFDFLAQNFTFTQDDLCESALIRNGLRRVLTRILMKRGLTALAVNILSVKVLPTGKISCVGEATMLFGPPLLFEVQSGIAFSSRGHILTLPGLKISLNPSLGFFVPVIPDVTVDLGHNAQLLDVTIDGENAELRVSARVTITPEHTIQLKKYIQLSQSYGALCSVDVGRWLTRVGRFTS